MAAVDQAANGAIVRVAAVGDLHCTRTSAGAFHQLFTQVSGAAQMLLLAGDLTDTGLPEEARILARELAALHVPGIAVLGNHDHESGHQTEIVDILSSAGLTVLDGDTCEVQGVGFAGVKGFAGGFGRRALGPWGESIVKQFVHEAVNESLKLESALARLRTDKIIVLLHYAPIEATVEGEPREIFPYLGCSRLAEPLSRFAVTAVIHGHAHNGALEGRTASNVPVYNVAYPLMKRLAPERPFRLLEI